jgi:hypothetical protein
MTDSEGTYSQLVEIAEKQKRPSSAEPKSRRPASKKAAEPEPREDLATTPYISQNYRFTEDELRWLRRQAYNLTERIGTKVSQNTILRVALQMLREVCTRSPARNPLTEAITKVKR